MQVRTADVRKLARIVGKNPKYSSLAERAIGIGPNGLAGISQYVYAANTADIAAWVRPEDIVPALKGAPATVDIDITDDGVGVTAGPITREINTVSETEVPTPAPAGITPDTVTPSAWEILDNCRSNDDARPTLCAIYFDDEQIAATDSYRLAVLPGTGAKGLLPHDVCRAVSILKAKRDSVSVGFGETSVTAKVGDWSVTAHNRDLGNYPNYPKLRPLDEDLAYTATVDNPADAAKILRSMRIDANTPVKWRNATWAVGAAETAGPAWHNADTVDTEYHVGFNPAFLADALAVANGGPATVSMVSELKAAVITGELGEVLLMPIRL